MPVIPLEVYFVVTTKNALTSGIFKMMKSVAIKPLLVLVAGLLWAMEWSSVNGQQPPKFQAIKLGALFTQDDTRDVKQAN